MEKTFWNIFHGRVAFGKVNYFNGSGFDLVNPKTTLSPGLEPSSRLLVFNGLKNAIYWGRDVIPNAS